MKKEKPFLMREPIHKEGMTLVEKIELWFVRRGWTGQKLFCKWWITILKEELDDIDLDTKDIKLTPLTNKYEKRK